MDAWVNLLGWAGMIGPFGVMIGGPLVGVLLPSVLLVGLWDGPLGEGGVRGWLQAATVRPSAPEPHEPATRAPARP